MNMAPIYLESCPAACKSSGIFQHFSRPMGWVGWCIGQLMAVKNRRRSEWVISLLKVQPNDRILEIGFGSGVDIFRVSELAPQGFVVGIDHSEVMVQQATKRNATAIQSKRVELQCTSVSEMTYASETFDKIFSINVAQFWTHPVEILAELHRVLKLGGLIVIAIQPRIPNATEAISQETGKFLVNILNMAGFEQIQLETKPMQPVSIVCALGIKKQA